jgi:MSHA pilin protein MshC
MKREIGFTIIELVVVIIVIGILSVAVFPNMNLMQGFNEAGYKDAIKSGLEFSRKSAIGQRRNVKVALSNSALTFTIDNDVLDGASAGTYPRALALPARSLFCSPGVTNMVCAPSGVALTGTNTIVYTPLGKLSGGAAASYVVSGKASFSVTVEGETGYVH